MCSEKQDLIHMAATVVSVAKDITQVKTQKFQVINPFTQSCNGTSVDLQKSLLKLEQMHSATLNILKEKELQETLIVYDELELFHPDAFSKFMSNAQFQGRLKEKIKKLKSLQTKIVNQGYTKTARTMAQERLRFVALGALQDFTGLNIQNVIQNTAQIKTFMTAAVQTATSESIANSLKEMGTNFLKTSAKSLGKGFVAGLIMTAGLESISYVTGHDVTAYDPFQVFLPTAAADGTVSGALNKQVSLTLYPEYQESLDMGFLPNPDLFSAKLYIMAMVAESLSKEKNMFSFLNN